MKLTRSLLALSSLAAAFTTTARAVVETYAIDSVHSSVGFSIRRIVSKVPGSFTKFSGTITVDRDDLEKSSVEATIEVASVNTADTGRDDHLKTPDFFDAAKFPSITFKSKTWKKTGKDAFDVTGDLTLHGVTKPVVLKVNLDGFAPGQNGAQISGWDATTTLNKADFGVNGPAMLGTMLGDEVAVTINISANQKK
jgi:polyisoprenoid-binding protein YceI